MAGFVVKKAKREKIFTKVALMAPSGGGKTYSSLRLATGMAEEIEKENSLPYTDGYDTTRTPAADSSDDAGDGDD